MFSAEGRVARKAERTAAREAAQAAHQQRRDTKLELKDYVKTNRALASYNGVHVYPDRIIRLPHMLSSGNFGATPECRPIAGVTATVQEMLSPRRMDRKTDARRGVIVIDGPDFQWRVMYDPNTFNAGLIRKFCEVVNTAGRKDSPAQAAAATQPGDPIDQLRRLAELRDAGIVTQAEFEAKKASLLAQ